MNNIDKVYFWSTIMRDHAEFFLLTLSSREEEFIERAKIFKSTFIQIENELKNKKMLSENLIENIYSVVKDFIEYKQEAIRKLLLCDIELNLVPTFINHMINEAMEFLKTLDNIKTKIFVNPIEETINLHKIWLPDAAGHAAGIMSTLDSTEADFIDDAEDFKEEFNNFFIKADELGKMLERTGLNDGNLTYLNEQVIEEINDFIEFLNDVMILRKECKLLGDLNPLMPDHMIREEKYYLDNIKNITKK